MKSPVGIRARPLGEIGSHIHAGGIGCARLWQRIVALIDDFYDLRVHYRIVLKKTDITTGKNREMINRLKAATPKLPGTRAKIKIWLPPEQEGNRYFLFCKIV